MTTESTPLLEGNAQSQPSSAVHDAVYDRFSPRMKKLILLQISFGGIVPMFVSGSFVPSIPQIARDFDTTGSVINLAVSLSIAASAMGTVTWATYCGFYGRRPVYLSALPVLSIGSLGVACARSVPELMCWRVLQAFGAGGGFAIGSGVIGDIYRLEERGKAMGIFFAASLLGPALAPPIGGLASHFASWRVMQLALCAAGMAAWGCMFLFFPETSQPRARGIDKLMEMEDAVDGERGDGKGWRWVWLNPFESLWLLRSPNVLAICVVTTAVLLTDLLLLVPMAYTVGNRYNIHNEALIGLLFTPLGLGNIIGAPLSGRLSDRIVVKWRARRKGVWVPEDRLRACIFGAGVLVPLSVLLSGVVTHYIPGPPGIALNVVCLFMNGVGVDFSLTPMAAYNVDILHAKSAEVMAATTALRSVILAGAVSGMLPLIERIGVLATNSAGAAVAWAGFGLLWVTIRYGGRMRAFVDVGFSTPADN